MFLKFILVALYIALCLPLAKWMQKHIGEEIARKYSHIRLAPIMWFAIIFIFGCDPFWSITAAIVYMIISTICQFTGLVANERNGQKSNEMATVWYSLSMAIFTILLVLNPREWFWPFSFAFFTLSHGDAFAALVGKRFGKYTMQLPHNKSLAGSIAFVVSSIYAMLIPCILGGYGFTYIWQIIVIAIASAIVEIYSGDYDNLLIPLAAGFLAFILI